MRPGGTNLLDSRELCRCSQAPYPYDAYPPGDQIFAWFWEWAQSGMFQALEV